MQSSKRGISSQRVTNLIKKIEGSPKLFERIERIFQIVEDETGEAMTADEAEELLFQELRKVGHDALEEWAVIKERRIEKEYESRCGIVKREKKRSGGKRGLGE